MAVGSFQLRSSEIEEWTDIEPDPTQITYSPWSEIRDLHDAGRRGLGYATLEWDWGSTVLRGDTLRTLQQFCAAPNASTNVQVRTLVNEFDADGFRVEKCWQGVMSRVDVNEFLFRMSYDWATGVRVSFRNLVAMPGFEKIDDVVLNAGEYSLQNGVFDYDAGYGYLGCLYSATVGQIVKVSLPDMARMSSLVLEVGDIVRSMVIDTEAEVAYCGTNASPANILKIDLADMSLANRLALQAGENQALGAAIDVEAGFAYFGLALSPGKIVKVRLANLTEEAVLTLPAGESYTYALAIDSEGGWLYAATYQSPSKVIKIDLSTFTRDSAVTLDADDKYCWVMTIDTELGYGYVASYSATTTVIAEVRLSDLTRTGEAVGIAGEYYYRGLVIDSMRGYLYCGIRGATGVASKIIRWTYPGLVRVDAVTLDADQTRLYCMGQDARRGYLYGGIYETPSQVVKVGCGP